MFKLVVLCAYFAAAAAKPGALIAAPITQYSTFLTPGATTITRQDSSVIHPSPLIYQAPLAYTHFIKKRSAQIPLTYTAPAYYSNYPTLYAATTYKARALPFPIGPLPAPIGPLPASIGPLPAPIGPLPAPIGPLPAPIAQVPALHLIKKRSAVLPATTYFAPSTYAATTPVLASTYAATSPIYSTPLISQPLISQSLISQPLYTHLIKKRSAGLLNAYVAPTSYSHQSRFDLQTTHTPYSSISYASPAIAYQTPLAYSSPAVAVSHVY